MSEGKKEILLGDCLEDYDYNDWDMEGMKAEQERISNGFRLFGKYYESLWD